MAIKHGWLLSMAVMSSQWKSFTFHWGWCLIILNACFIETSDIFFQRLLFSCSHFFDHHKTLFTYPHRQLHSVLPEQLSGTALWPEKRQLTSVALYYTCTVSRGHAEVTSQLTFSSRAISCVLFRPLACSSRSLAPELSLSSDIHWTLNTLSCICNWTKKLLSAKTN